MKKIFFSLAFLLIGTFVFANNGSSNELPNNTLKTYSVEESIYGKDLVGTCIIKIGYYDEDGNLYSKKTGKKLGFLRGEYLGVNFVFQDYRFATRVNKIIFCLHNGRWAKKGYKIDHINEKKTDNRPCNLRESTSSQNASNKSLYKNNKSGAKGVFVRSISDDRVRVNASVSYNGKSYTKSMTVKPEFVEATVQILKAWRDEMGRKLHGEFFNEG